MQVLQQDRVDLTHESRRAVIALHQLLGRALARGVLEPELLRERRLQVEHEAVLATAREIVEPDAKSADQLFATRHRARLLERDEAVRSELAPRPAEPGRTRDPDDRLKVAQAAGTFLDVRLEVVRGVVMLDVPLLLLERLALVERAHVERVEEALLEFVEQLAAAGEQAMLEETRSHGHVTRQDRK